MIAVRFRLWILALITSLALASHASAASLSEDEILAFAYASQEAHSTPGADSEIERRAFVHAGGKARRENNKLILSLAAGSDTFIDVPSCASSPEKCGVFKLVLLSSTRNLALVHRFAEGKVSYIVVYGATLGESEFGDFPHLSPSGDWAVGDAWGQHTSDARDPVLEGPHLRLSLRNFTGRYVSQWWSNPHYPTQGKVEYKFDRWFSDTSLAAHIEVDGAVTARFRLDLIDSDWVVVDLP